MLKLLLSLFHVGKVVDRNEWVIIDRVQKQKNVHTEIRVCYVHTT